MGLSVQQLLELPVLEQARPEVLVGSGLERREVRWVHTSEIYAISPLLKGGEVLLTTGLGLVGLPGAAMASYVDALARQGVAALLLELGRTFPQPPEALVEAARRHDFPLVVLHGVVPFVDVTEAVHPLLITSELDQLRALDAAATRLHEALAAGAAPRELLEVAREVCGVPVGLYAAGGELLAGADVRAGSRSTLDVEVGRSGWAVLVLAPGPGSEVVGIARLARLCASVVDLRLGGLPGSPQRSGGGADLVRALATGQYLSSDDIDVHVRRAGLVVGPGHRPVGLAVDPGLPAAVRPGLSAAAAAARTVFGTALVADTERELLVATTVPPAELRARVTAYARTLEAELRATVGPGRVRVAAGPVVEDTGGLARSLPAARDALHLASRLNLPPGAILAADLGVYHLLSSVSADPDLERFVEAQLGPLLEHDARHSSDLVATLDAYLEAGLSKTAAARALGVRRQTLYGRLGRIQQLLGGVDFESRQARTALDLALVTWRMRSSAANRRL